MFATTVCHEHIFGDLKNRRDRPRWPAGANVPGILLPFFHNMIKYPTVWRVKTSSDWCTRLDDFHRKRPGVMPGLFGIYMSRNITTIPSLQVRQNRFPCDSFPVNILPASLLMSAFSFSAPYKNAPGIFPGAFFNLPPSTNMYERNPNKVGRSPRFGYCVPANQDFWFDQLRSHLQKQSIR